MKLKKPEALQSLSIAPLHPKLNLQLLSFHYGTRIVTIINTSRA
jgi:hypothetical protein